MRKSILVSAAVLVLASLGLACGPSSSHTCCINGQAYNCASMDDMSSCESKCTRDPSRDAPTGSTTCKPAS